MVLGEFLICCYNVILHQATFAEGHLAHLGSSRSLNTEVGSQQTLANHCVTLRQWFWFGACSSPATVLSGQSRGQWTDPASARYHCQPIQNDDMILLRSRAVLKNGRPKDMCNAVLGNPIFASTPMGFAEGGPKSCFFKRQLAKGHGIQTATSVS